MILRSLDRKVWANSADPDHSVPKGAVWSGFTLFAIPSVSSTIKSHYSNFRIIKFFSFFLFIFKVYNTWCKQVTEQWQEEAGIIAVR